MKGLSYGATSAPNHYYDVFNYFSSQKTKVSFTFFTVFEKQCENSL